VPADDRRESFPPLVGDDSRILILGSMPGVASLAAHAYYAHPRNAFWPIVATITGVPAAAPYDERTAGLLAAGLALWDVAASCMRRGSLDAAIVDASVVAHDVAGLLRQHPGLRRVCLNGGKAATLFSRHVARAVSDLALDVRVLPSTSPAHAGMALRDKMSAWQAALRAELPGPASAHQCGP
jgi:TDG/mug DNA glycosylase family protein